MPPLCHTPAARGLLGRLTGARGRRSERDAVLAHLQAILNTRRGESPSSPELGVLDFADVVHSFPAGAGAALHSLRAAIARHEPRLRAVTVQRVASDDPLTLAFEITGRLGDAPLRARADLSATGEFRVVAP